MNNIEQDFKTTFYHKINMYLNQNQKQKAINYLISTLDDLLEREQFNQCESVIDVVELEKLPIEFIISFLAITRPYREDLPERAIILSIYLSDKSRKLIEKIY